MQSLLLVAHGSRKKTSNAEVDKLVEQLARKATQFGYISGAFLEFAIPSIPQGIQNCIDKGATKIIVLPYFLSAGRHVTEDIPAEVEKKHIECPDIQIKIANYFGGSEDIVETLLRLAIRE